MMVDDTSANAIDQGVSGDKYTLFLELSQPSQGPSAASLTTYDVGGTLILDYSGPAEAVLVCVSGKYTNAPNGTSSYQINPGDTLTTSVNETGNVSVSVTFIPDSSKS